LCRRSDEILANCHDTGSNEQKRQLSHRHRAEKSRNGASLNAARTRKAGGRFGPRLQAHAAAVLRSDADHVLWRFCAPLSGSRLGCFDHVLSISAPANKGPALVYLHSRGATLPSSQSFSLPMPTPTPTPFFHRRISGN
jgi:hypothetical protein